MKQILYPFSFLFSLLTLLFVACQEEYKEPIVSLDPYRLTEGFDLQVVASEPLLTAPVAMDFGPDGRIWVAQMPGFMNDLDGSGESEPSGSIRILEDLDNDGTADHAKVFLDSLVMPRALAHVYGGLLYAEPPNLWFVEIENDRPKNRVLVDSLYAPEGNPEHQPNGLLLHTDNWIYNANSTHRYRRKEGKWVKQAAPARGQWGISQDDFGRLYYNNNSTLLLGDQLLPHVLVRNKWFIPKKGLNDRLVQSQRVYPLHAASVNRGYSPKTLNADSILLEATSTCSPLVYRGNAFPDGYNGNLFVCVPEGNLIKRIILTETDGLMHGEQAWENKEFLAATDEGFRPVYLKNGLDGSLYVVDLHRGVIQHHAFLSPYLRKRAREKQLDTIVSKGRILKISAKGAPMEKYPNFQKADPEVLVQLLGHENGAIRTKAQYQLVYKKYSGMIPDLEQLALQTKNPLAQIHALYTLQGIDGLSFELLTQALQIAQPQVVAHTLLLMEGYASPEKAPIAFSLYKKLVKKQDPTINLYILATMGTWAHENPEQWFSFADLLLKDPNENVVMEEAFLSGIGPSSKNFYTLLSGNASNKVSERMLQDLRGIVKNQENNALNPIYEDKPRRADSRTAGAKLYRQLCAVCHGIDGRGTENLAPPLMGSKYVRDHEKLARIILHGLTGPIKVNGESYNFTAAMPGFYGNQSLTDRDIKDIMSYVGNAFSNRSKSVTLDRIKELRVEKSKSGAEYTEEELLQLGR
ncbi:DUF7133 domain-containing protein [Pareuzebyella sediminis]|uniref:DUF7133 domain-containing protein n=1 Tax=Pareuzebyella sediminis TaxID=2607998 RepID=UPI0011ED882A|nr:c-type cytochrome [Pareuzebyella sediminis]